MRGRVVVVIVGMGYVGLPLAQEAVRSGHDVVGYDLDDSVVAGLNAGRSHVDDLDDGDIRAMLAAGFTATTDSACMSAADVIIVCVPTPLAGDGGPDLSAVVAAGRSIADSVSPDTLVVLESTTYPGTTEELFVPLVESSGLVVGEDVFVAYSPERVDPGNQDFGVRNTPKVVGGVTDRCTSQAVAFYESFIDKVVVAAGTREAEMAKLLENTYRHVNIALVNEMARFCHDMSIDLWDVIRCASTKPFGYEPFYPGPGVGGHCIPIDPNYLGYAVRARLGYPFRFVELAHEINQSMPGYVVRRAQDLLNAASKPLRGSTVLLVGVTYKANIADMRESPAIPVAEQLARSGASVSFHDPYISEWQVAGAVVRSVPDVVQAAGDADLVVVLQRHAGVDWAALAERAPLLLDTRGTDQRRDTVTTL
jgi:nucleotide sugar dehydrogenase